MKIEETKEKIRAFFSRFVGDVEIDENEDLFGPGLVNSLFAMQLIMYIEKNYDIKVSKEDLDIKNFSSIKAISQFIHNKKGFPQVN
ncbi:MAG: phosphopantetheine-binding protein [Gammaproteobacteria bacterium]|nr:phosphopantetheine-binding protein [Gammaproteobacteria bacterium]